MKKLALGTFAIIATIGIMAQTNSIKPTPTEIHTTSKKNDELAQFRGRVVNFSEIVSHFGSADKALNTIKNSNNVVLDFYADWCSPCNAIAPTIANMAHKFPTILFVKIDTQAYQSISNHFGIRSIPTLIYLKNGSEIKRNIGLMSEKELINQLTTLFV